MNEKATPKGGDIDEDEDEVKSIDRTHVTNEPEEIMDFRERIYEQNIRNDVLDDSQSESVPLLASESEYGSNGETETTKEPNAVEEEAGEMQKAAIENEETQLSEQSPETEPQQTEPEGAPRQIEPEGAPQQIESEGAPKVTEPASRDATPEGSSQQSKNKKKKKSGKKGNKKKKRK